MKEITFGKERLEEVARTFIQSIGGDRIFLFEGEMGAGKTTFIVDFYHHSVL